MTRSDVRQRLLREIEKQNVTWHYGYRKGETPTCYRLYSSEYVYRPLTTTEKRHLLALLEEGKVKQFQGLMHGRGGFEVSVRDPQGSEDG